MFNNGITVLNYIYTLFIGVFSYYYLLILSSLLLTFFLFRVPYCYSPHYFYVILAVFIFSCFVSLFLRRLFNNSEDFFSSFIPVGTPIFICPLVCLAETVSYIIRPFVLILRPFINISLGCVGAVSVGGLCFTSWYVMLPLFLIFLYEVFVALVHWYIVTSILSFSLDH